MDALIYLRRSVVDEDNPGVVSHQQQLDKCRALAMVHGPAEPDVLIDWGKSGGEGLEHRRSAYQELRDRIAGGGIKWVISYDLSRLSRSTRETLDLIDFAGRHGTKVHVGDLGILDPEDPVGKFTVTALAGANTLLRDIASKRAKEAVEKRRSDGLPIGRPPYGALPGEDVARVLAAYDEAGSYHEAARLLNGRGVPSRMGTGWQGPTVRRIVQRERKDTAQVTAIHRVRSRGRYMLTGLLYCHCGTPMRVQSHRHGPIVICGKGQSDKGHPRPVEVSQAKLLPAIKTEAARLALPASVEQELHEDEAAVRKLDAKRDRWLEQYAEGIIEKPERDRQLAKIAEARSNLAVRSVVIQLPPAIDWTWPPEAVNGVLRALWERVDLGPDLMPVRFVWRTPEWRSEHNM